MKILSKILLCILISTLGVTTSSCFSSKDEPLQEGCTDQLASNYDPNADILDNSCEYPLRSFGFYTNTADGGTIHLAFSSTPADGSESGITMGFDSTEMTSPVCGTSDLTYFYRHSNHNYGYTAWDEDGNEWAGNVSAAPNECKLVPLRRLEYGEVRFYLSTRPLADYYFVIFQNFNHDQVKIYDWDISSNTPNCDGSDHTARLKEGLIIIKIGEHINYDDVRFHYDTLAVKSGRCLQVDLAQYH